MKTNNLLKFLIESFCCFFLLSSFAFSQPVLKANVVSSGGSVLTNSNYILNGSLGQSAVGIVINSNYIHRAGFWENIRMILTEVADSESELPVSFNLSQNYPNPFNPSTKIKYSVPVFSKIQIKVFDILGNIIETLIDEEKPVGTYEITWFAENLPSGIYFYTIKAVDPESSSGRGFVETKKMVLLK
jgi:hypothetical protein